MLAAERKKLPSIKMPDFSHSCPQEGTKCRVGWGGVVVRLIFFCTSVTGLLWGGEGIRSITERVGGGGKLKGKSRSVAPIELTPASHGSLPGTCSSHSGFFPFRSNGDGISMQGVERNPWLERGNGASAF